MILCAGEIAQSFEITNRPCRFDVVAIDDALGERPAVVVYPNAFDATD